MDLEPMNSLLNGGEVLVNYALNLIGAVLLLIIGWIVANWARNVVRRSLERMTRIDVTLKPLIVEVCRYLILVFVVIAVLARFGVQTTSIIAVLGAAGLAVGLALQGTLSNIAAGVMLLLLGPVKVGEYIDAEGIAGTVDEIGLFTTLMRTYDGVYLSVPNSNLWNRTIKNYSRLPTRRIDLVVGVSYGDDLSKALEVLGGLLREDTRVLPEPTPQVLVKELSDSAVNLNLRCWVNRSDFWDVTFDTTKAAKLRLDAHGITIPFPQRDVHLIPSEGEKESG